jgi:hypothetical protein
MNLKSKLKLCKFSSYFQLMFLFLRKQAIGDQFYMQTHHRIGEYFIGIIFGFLTHDFNTSKKFSSFPSKFFVFLGWILSLLFLFTHVYLNPKSFLNRTNQNIYDTISKELWAVSICWIIFACHSLQSGFFIQKFLCHRSWQPLSKLCLSLYLTHFIYIMMTMANFKKRLIVDTWWEIHILVGDIFISIALAAIFYIVVEAPTANVIAILWKQADKAKVSGTTNVANVECIKVNSLEIYS